MRALLLALFAAVLVLVTACSSATKTMTISAAVERSRTMSADAPASMPTGEDNLTRAQLQAVDRVRTATDRFSDQHVALAAGYSRQYPAGCAQSSDGSQGFHYLNPALVDAKVDLLHPELVMYEPQKDGSLQLVGVDYVVPFDQWKSDAPPQLLGVPFMRNETLGVWALHIWAWRMNPSGMFAMWNPSVSCPKAS